MAARTSAPTPFGATGNLPPFSYVARVCPTGFAPDICITSAVRNLEPVESWSRDSGGDWTLLEKPVDPIEDIIRSLEGSGCDESVSVDSVYRFPTEAYSDCGEEGSGYEVECFVADSLDVSLCQ